MANPGSSARQQSSIHDSCDSLDIWGYLIPMRVLSFVLHFIRNRGLKPEDRQHVEVPDLDEALRVILCDIRLAQQQAFPTEYYALRSSRLLPRQSVLANGTRFLTASMSCVQAVESARVPSLTI